MLESWNDAIISDINVAIWVAPHSGKSIHHNRPFHGFVFNDSISSKKIHFSDGSVLHTGPKELHYLPKGSSYRVETIIPGSCWAINFALLDDIPERPFSLHLRNYEPVQTLFKDAVNLWKVQSPICNASIRKILYEIIIKVKNEQLRSYMPNKKEHLIQPALDLIARDYTKNDLTVEAMADLCQISVTYFRRIFKEKFSISPKEYIINLRMEYAKKLLESTQVSVGEVAQMCGYFEPCHFSREFSKHTGISPKDYAKTNKMGG